MSGSLRMEVPPGCCCFYTGRAERVPLAHRTRDADRLVLRDLGLEPDRDPGRGLEDERVSDEPERLFLVARAPGRIEEAVLLPGQPDAGSSRLDVDELDLGAQPGELLECARDAGLRDEELRLFLGAVEKPDLDGVLAPVHLRWIVEVVNGRDSHRETGLAARLLQAHALAETEIPGREL